MVKISKNLLWNQKSTREKSGKSVRESHIVVREKYRKKAKKTFHAHSWFSREKKNCHINVKLPKKRTPTNFFVFTNLPTRNVKKPANYQLRKIVNLPTFQISQTYQLKISKTCKLPTFFAESGGGPSPPLIPNYRSPAPPSVRPSNHIKTFSRFQKGEFPPVNWKSNIRFLTQNKIEVKTIGPL